MSRRTIFWLVVALAGTIFVGERTVASHLTHIYTKLGVRSRTELAHMTK